jgi:hypothetical protein
MAIRRRRYSFVVQPEPMPRVGINSELLFTADDTTILLDRSSLRPDGGQRTCAGTTDPNSSPM